MIKTTLWAAFVIISLCENLQAQKKDNGFLIVQGSLVQYKKSAPIAAGSLTFGLRIKKVVGVAANIQTMKFKDDKSFYTPLCFDLSLLPMTSQVSPYFNFQIGKAIYSNNFKVTSTSATVETTTDGGLFLSPGIGVRLKASKSVGFLLTASYVNSAFSSTTKASSRTGTSSKTQDYNTEGYRIGFGLYF